MSTNNNVNGNATIDERTGFSATIVYVLLAGSIASAIFLGGSAVNVAQHLTRIDDRLFQLEQKAGIKSEKSE